MSVTLKIGDTKIPIEQEGADYQPTGMKEKLEARFDDLLSLATSLATATQSAAFSQQGENTPSSVAVTLGFKLNAESDWMIAKVAGEGSVQLTFTYE